MDILIGQQTAKMFDKDIEPDVSEERRQQLRELFRQFGEHTKMLVLVARLTGKPLPLVVIEWKETKREIESALNHKGRTYGP